MFSFSKGKEAKTDTANSDAEETEAEVESTEKKVSGLFNKLLK